MAAHAAFVGLPAIVAQGARAERIIAARLSRSAHPRIASGGSGPHHAGFGGGNSVERSVRVRAGCVRRRRAHRAGAGLGCARTLHGGAGPAPVAFVLAATGGAALIAGAGRRSSVSAAPGPARAARLGESGGAKTK